MAGLVGSGSQVLSDRLPGEAPVVAVGVVAQIHIVARSVERHGIGPETGDAVGLRVTGEHVAAGIVRNHGSRVLGSEVVGPRNRHIGPGDHILFSLVVKIAVLHSPIKSLYAPGVLFSIIFAPQTFS